MKMIDFFYRLAKSAEKHLGYRNSSGIRNTIRTWVNVLSHLYFTVVPIGKSMPRSAYTKDEIILSLTSFPKRFKKIRPVLETIFRQTVKADRIILWLADSQFPDKENVNRFLDKYIKLGLEVKYCKDIRAHKKYFFTMAQYPDSSVIILDDDIFYPSDTVEKLILKHNDFPDRVICNRAHGMTFESGNLLPYTQWNWLARKNVMNSRCLFPTGGVGRFILRTVYRRTFSI